jgi:RNA polymerase sigma-70 factor (ECF subfamily)
LDDRTLVQRVKDGDPAAERALYDAHVDRVYGLAYRMTGDETLARDLTQDAFVRAFDRIDGYRGDAALSTWLHTVTTSVVLNGLRKVRRIREREVDLDHARKAAAKDRRSEPDLRDRLHAAIAGLPDGYRKVFVMHDVEGYTHLEIARALGVAEGTSKAQLSRARAKLRVELADYAEEWVA